jgi:hypothetical protein
MYSKINVHNLQNPEFIQFIKNLLSIVKKENPELLNVIEQFDKLLAVYTAMHGFYKPEIGSKLTKNVKELDAERDNSLLGIMDVLDGYKKHYLPELQAAAELLLSSITIYGNNIPRNNYQKESAIIEKICFNWKNEDQYINALTQLHLVDWANRLSETNAEFEKQHMKRLEMDANAPEVKMADYRTVCTEHYQNLLKYLNANAVLNGEEAYKALALKVNKLIEINNRLIDGRAKKTEETLIME